MSLVTYIIFAKTLYKIHEKKSGCNEWERMKDETAVFRKQSICPVSYTHLDVYKRQIDYLLKRLYYILIEFYRSILRDV